MWRGLGNVMIFLLSFFGSICILWFFFSVFIRYYFYFGCELFVFFLWLSRKRYSEQEYLYVSLTRRVCWRKAKFRVELHPEYPINRRKKRVNICSFFSLVFNDFTHSFGSARCSRNIIMLSFSLSHSFLLPWCPLFQVSNRASASLSLSQWSAHSSQDHQKCREI